MPISPELLGYAGAGLTILSAWAHSIWILRLCSLGSNAAMIFYATSQDLTPVLIQHSILLPLNLYHVARIFRTRGTTRRVRATSLS